MCESCPGDDERRVPAHQARQFLQRPQLIKYKVLFYVTPKLNPEQPQSNIEL